jgi:uncharacterized protein
MTHQGRISRRVFVTMAGAGVILAAIAQSGMALAEIDLDKANQVPLTIAAAQGNLKKVHDLLLSGTPPNLTDISGRPAIGWAALEGHTDVIQELLKAPRIFVNAKDQQGNTAVLLAAQRGHAEAVDALIAGKADLNLDNNDGMTALMYAAQNGYLRIVQALVKAGADPTIQDRTGRTALDWAQDSNRQDVAQFLQRAAAK